VELEYLFHRVGPRRLLTTWLCQAAERAHAKIRDCRSGRCDSAFCSLNTVVHVDDAEIELGFWMKLEPLQWREIGGIVLRDGRHVNIADRTVDLLRQSIAPVDMDVVVLTFALVDVPDRTQVKAQFDLWRNAIGDIRDDGGLVLQLIRDFLLTRGFERRYMDSWLADLSEVEQRNASFFSLNRYFFSVELQAATSNRTAAASRATGCRSA
jgi:hypothetical protein